MIKRISVDDTDLLAFQITLEMEEEDVEWMLQRVVKQKDRTEKQVLLYLEFENFGEMTLPRIWDHFKMFMDSILVMIKNVKKIAVVTSNVFLREKLALEFKLVPTVSLKPFHPDEKDLAVEWLQKS